MVSSCRVLDRSPKRPGPRWRGRLRQRQLRRQPPPMATSSKTVLQTRASAASSLRARSACRSTSRFSLHPIASLSAAARPQCLFLLTIATFVIFTVSFWFHTGVVARRMSFLGFVQREFPSGVPSFTRRHKSLLESRRGWRVNCVKRPVI